ncbi:unnamed protein product [Nippostrongylus brasiliensis]|uniref:DUF4780 domain-containing protein n=1 Tax=Nippostrongylus brasiliensis TaxID=27835 RepID=A0A0N4YU61_NIPBR|nr:unnamed protein product [Nippostrongylus brasiliensis]
MTTTGDHTTLSSAAAVVAERECVPSGRWWEGPWQRPTRTQIMMVLNSLESILKWLPEGINGEAYTSGSIPTPEDSSYVVLVIGKEFAKEVEIMGVLRPWMERLRNRDIQLMVVIAPREHNVEQNIAAWNKVAANLVTLKNFMSSMINCKWIGVDARS